MLRLAAELRAEPVATSLQVGDMRTMDVIAKRIGVTKVTGPVDPFTSLSGIPISVDLALEPDQWQIRDQAGNVLAEGDLGIRGAFPGVELESYLRAGPLDGLDG